MTSTELAVQQEAVDALMRQQAAEFEGEDVTRVPILKVAQPLSNEVGEGNAEVGEFINTVTGEGIGERVGFIPAYYQKGRSHTANKGKSDEKYIVAFEETIPESWGEYLGEQFVGTPFSEHPDAEEQYKRRVNAGEIEWGSGPPINTTHNWTGLVIVSAPEDSDEEDDVMPFRISFQRTGVASHRTIRDLLKMKARNKPMWTYVLDLSTYVKSFGKGRTALVAVKVDRKATDLEQAEAFELAQNVAAGRIAEVGSGQETEAAPEVKGGIGV
jgi:hypothetical protein